MRIALDYDDTFTNDDVLWMEFVRLAKARGHSVSIVTWRHPHEVCGQLRRDAELMGIDIVCCSRQQKSECHEADVWIDDMPHAIPSIAMLSAMTIGGK